MFNVKLRWNVNDILIVFMRYLINIIVNVVSSIVNYARMWGGGTVVSVIDC